MAKYRDIFDGDIFKPDYSGGTYVNLDDPIVVKAVELYNEEWCEEEEFLIDLSEMEDDGWYGISGENYHWYESAKEIVTADNVVKLLRDENVSEDVVEKVEYYLRN